MNWKPVFHVIAWLLGVVALLMAVCGLVSWLLGEAATAWRSLLVAGGGTGVVAVALWVATRNRHELSRRDGLGVVAFGWLLAGVAGAVPFVLSGVIASPVAALFESVSGLTTTGATVIPVLEDVPRGLLLLSLIHISFRISNFCCLDDIRSIYGNHPRIRGIKITRRTIRISSESKGR